MAYAANSVAMIVRYLWICHTTTCLTLHQHPPYSATTSLLSRSLSSESSHQISGKCVKAQGGMLPVSWRPCISTSSTPRLLRQYHGHDITLLETSRVRCLGDVSHLDECSGFQRLGQRADKPKSTTTKISESVRVSFSHDDLKT